MSKWMSLARIRTGFWHLRRGGIPALKIWLDRQNGTQRDHRSAHARTRTTIRAFRPRAKRLSFSPADLSPAGRPFLDLRAAVILDEFSSMCFAFEWTNIEVTPTSWLSQLAKDPVDILFVESAWAGNSGTWRYHLTGTHGPSRDLRELVAWCRDQGIPTVFWNKEDPPHYSDFLETARLFDFVFTSDATRCPHYVLDLGHDNVHVLPFAAQPKIHNPVRPGAGWHSRDVAFAGMYFQHKYPERREQMDYLLRGAIAAGNEMDSGLEIFSRMLGSDERYQFPAPFADRVVGQVPYAEMLTAYKAYKVFLNVNSVTESPSMCARRIFEISASGTPVVSAPSLAIHEFFPPEEVFVARDEEESRQTVRALARNSSLGERAVHLAQRRIWDRHTYSHRVADVLGRVGLAAMVPEPGVGLTCMVSTNRPDQLRHVFNQFSKQLYPAKQLVLLTHGFDPGTETLKGLRREYQVNDFVHLVRGQSVSLGSCLNAIVDVADGEVLTKMDDDDLYGEHYLGDLMHARSFSRAEVVGKSAHYMHLYNPDILIRRFRDKEHRFVHHVMGPTISASREVFRDIPFGDLDRGEDTDFLNRVRMSGGTIYASDRFNFVQVRGSHPHTWPLSDSEALATGDIESYGEFGGHVFL